MKDSWKQYTRISVISADILNGAGEHHLQLLPPVLGIIPQPVIQWLPDLPPSIVRVAFEAVRIPDSTRVAQNSYQEELFNRALLRRTALAATSENPEAFGYRSFVWILYTILAVLFWPSVPIVFLVMAAIVIRSPRNTTETKLTAFALSVMVIDVLCRISFYSIVDWILWDLDPRYVLGPSVLTVVIVSTLLTVWLAPAVGGALRPRLMKLPALWS